MVHLFLKIVNKNVIAFGKLLYITAYQGLYLSCENILSISQIRSFYMLLPTITNTHVK
jgi:hypothetical protein